MGDRPTVFISYSHADKDWKDLMVNHLGVLEKQQLLDLWDESRISPGDSWSSEIEQAIGRASVAIILISADFLNSDYVLTNTIPRLLDRRRTEGLHVIPVLVRACLWRHVAWLSEIQIIPLDERPLSNRPDIDAQLANIANEVHITTGGASRASLPPPSTRHIYPARTRKPASTRVAVAVGLTCLLVVAIAGAIFAYQDSRRFRADGQLWDTSSRTPIYQAEILMVGLSCDTPIFTDLTGNFHIDCKIPPLAKLTMPRARIRLPNNNAFCKETVPLLSPDLISVIEIDSACLTVVRPAGKELMAPAPPPPPSPPPTSSAQAAVPVTVSATPITAAAYVDGKVVKLPATFDVKHDQAITLWIRADGYEPKSVKLDGSEGIKMVQLEVVQPVADPPPKDPAPEPGDEFNRSAAVSTLAAAASAAKGCKKPDGPTGAGKVKVTFAPSGNVTSAQVEGPPFAGTPVGGCVQSTFLSARVPPFSGPPVSVSKSFTIL